VRLRRRRGQSSSQCRARLCVYAGHLALNDREAGTGSAVRMKIARRGLLSRYCLSRWGLGAHRTAIIGRVYAAARQLSAWLETSVVMSTRSSVRFTHSTYHFWVVYCSQRTEGDTRQPARRALQAYHPRRRSSPPAGRGCCSAATLEMPAAALGG